jgi:hypothetical protein
MVTVRCIQKWNVINVIYIQNDACFVPKRGNKWLYFQYLLTRQQMVFHLFVALTVSIRSWVLFPTLCGSINTKSMIAPVRSRGGSIIHRNTNLNTNRHIHAHKRLYCAGINATSCVVCEYTTHSHPLLYLLLNWLQYEMNEHFVKWIFWNIIFGHIIGFDQISQ